MTERKGVGNKVKKSPIINHFEQANKDDEALRQRIAEKAYELYQRRGFTHGCDLDDWLEAERQVLSESQGSPKRPRKKVLGRRRRSTEE